jgi:hypothetical protein
VEKLAEKKNGFLRLNGGKAAKKYPKARAHRAWLRNAERMHSNWTRSL